jgi:hypothetical protein
LPEVASLSVAEHPNEPSSTRRGIRRGVPSEALNWPNPSPLQDLGYRVADLLRRRGIQREFRRYTSSLELRTELTLERFMELTKVWPFTDRARRVLNLAEEESRVLNRGFVGTEHLLLGLIREGEGIAAKALEALNVSPGAVRLDVERVVGQRTCTPTDSPLLSPGLQKVLQLSVRESLQLGHNYIGTEHLLLGLVVEGEGVAARVLSNLGLAPRRVCQRVIQQLSGLQYR